jgi:hypothetical protein
MTVPRSRCVALLILALTAGGCGTPKEKTAPCKRPANLSSYASIEGKCGPIRALNADRAAALAAIQDLASGVKE